MRSNCLLRFSTRLMELESKEVVHERYKDLSKIEWAFRAQKRGYVGVRPIYLRTEQHTVAHLVIGMLAYKIERDLRRAWKGLISRLKRDFISATR